VSGNNVTLNDINALQFGGASTISGNLVVTTAGAITDGAAGTLVVTGTTSLTAGVINNITLDNANNFGGDVTVVSGNNVTLNDINAIQFGGVSTISGNLIVTAAGAITDGAAGTLAVTGTTNLTAGAANDITLDNANNFIGDVTIVSGNNVTLNDINAIQFGGVSTISGNLIVTAAGVITDGAAGTLAVTGTTSLTAGATNNIILDNANNFIGDVTIVSGKDVKLNDINAIQFGGVSTISSDLVVTAAGAITDGAAGTLFVTGTTSLTAGAGNNITLDNANNFVGAVSIVSGNNVTLNDINAIDLGTSTVSGNLIVTAAGTITDSGNLLITGTTSLTAGAGNNITLDNANNFVGDVTVVSGNNVTLNDINAIQFGGASTISGNLIVTAAGAITDGAAGTLAVTGTTSLTAGAGNNITLDNANNFVGDVTVVSGNNVTLHDINAIQFGGASTISGNLIVTAAGPITDGAAGTLAVAGTTNLTAGPGNNIILDNGNDFGGVVTVVSSNNTTLNDINSLLIDSITATSTASLTAATTITDASGGEAANITAPTIDLNAGTGIGTAGDDINIIGTTLTADTTTGVINISNVPAAAVTINSMTTGNASNITYKQTVQNLIIAGAISSGGGNIWIDPPVDIAINANVTTTGAGTIWIQGTGNITTANGVTISTDSGALTIEGGVPGAEALSFVMADDSTVASNLGGNITIRSNTITLDNVTTTGDVLLDSDSGAGAVTTQVAGTAGKITADDLIIQQDAASNINVATNVATLNVTNGNNVTVTEDNGIILKDINAVGTFTLTTSNSGAVTSAAGTKITADHADINADGAIDINTNINQITIATTNDNVLVDEDNALALNLVDAGTGDVSIILAAGAITDNNGGSTNIIGNDLTLTAIDGIGSGDALETDVDNLQATNTNNGIEIVNTGALTLTDLNGLGYAVSNTNGLVDIRAASSPLNVDADVIAGGDITLIADDDNVALNDDITIATNVNITAGGDVLLRAGDDVVQIVGAGIVSAGGGDIQIIASHDNDGIGLIDMAGTVGSGNESLTLYADQGINLANAQVAQLNAYNISSGDINITNTGALTIDDFSSVTLNNWGVENDNGGVAIINTGSIDIPGTSGAGVYATGDILLRALGVTSDITAGSAASMDPAIGSTGGSVTLEAGRDIYLGQNHYADIYTDSGPGSITLTAGNDITIDNDTYIESASGLINMTAGNNLSLISTGHISSTTGNISLTATSGNIVIGPNAGGVLSTSGDISLSAGNNIDLGILQTSGDVALTLLTGAVTDNNGAALNVTADDLVIIAPGGVDLDTSVNTLTADTTGSNGDVAIREDDGLELNLVDAGTGDVTIILAAGAITDNNGVSTNIIGDDLTLSAVDGIGSGDALETQVNRLQATNTNNGIEITNTGALTLADINTLGYAVQNTNGWVKIIALSPLNVNANVTGGLDIQLIAGDNDAANNDDLTIAANVNIQSTAGDILLQAGDDITQAAGTGVISAGGGDIDLVAGHDNDGNGLINILGKVGSGAENLYVEADQTITALTNVATLTAQTDDADITVTEDNGLGLNLVDAGTGNVAISLSDGAITDNNGDSNNINATDVVLSAVTGIGSGDALEMTVDRLAARVTTGNGNIEIVNTGDLDLDDLSGWGYAVQNSGTGTIDITVNSNITIAGEIVSGGGNIFLTAAGGAILDDNAVDPDISGPAGVGLQMIASGGIGNGNEIETDVTMLTAQSETGPIDIHELDTTTLDGLTITQVSGGSVQGISTTGNINLNVEGALTQDNDNNITSNGGNITINATSLTQNDDSAINAQTGGDVNVTTTGDISLDSISGADVTLTSTAGGIAETGAGDAELDITATNLILSASTGIGSGNALETDVDNLQATNTNNGVEIANTGGMTIVGTGVSNTNGWVALSTSGALMVNSSVNAGGYVALTATGGANGDVTINADITANGVSGTTGNGVRILSDDDVIQNANITSNNTIGAVYVEAGIGTTDGIITMANGTSTNSRNDNGAVNSIEYKADGDISISLLSSTGTVKVTTTTGAIIDNNLDSNNISGNTAILTAANGIGYDGATANALETTVTNLDAVSTNNDINIANTGDLDLIDMNGDGHSVWAQNGNIDVRTQSSIEIDDLVEASDSVYLYALTGSITDDLQSADVGLDIKAGADSGLYAGGGVIGWENPATGIWTRDPIEVDTGRLFVYASDVAGPYPVSVDIRGVAEIDVRDDWGTPPGLILYNDSIVGGGNIEDLYRATTPDLDTKSYEFSQYLQWLLETIVDDELSAALDQDDRAKMKKKKWWRYITR
jgi:hypothetical protein